MSAPNRGGRALIAGGLAAVLASGCCLGPLALVTLGVSGAWIANLTRLEPYRPLFLGISVVALYFAWRQVWVANKGCEPEKICATPGIKRLYRWMFWLVVVLVGVGFVYPLVLPLFY